MFSSKELLASIANMDEQNKYCFDCSQSPADWVSLDFGIIICVNCAGQHRSFGTQITSVRSILLDNWSQEQVQFIKMGGNSLFRNYLTANNINSLNIREIYLTPIVLYYRQE